jgi:hypothetical protein
MRQSWPHAPPHYFTPGGVYLITAATLHRKRLFHSDEKLDLLLDTTFELAKTIGSFYRHGLSFPITIILLLASKTARPGTRISSDTCIMNWQFDSTIRPTLLDGE